MTRRDYVLIAGALRAVRPSFTLMTVHELKGWEACVKSISDACKAQNAHFNPKRFWEACNA